MSIATHSSEADLRDVTATGRPGAGSCLGDASHGIAAPPRRDLLPSGGTPARDPALASSRALALDARRVLRRWDHPATRPVRWSEPDHVAQVEAIHHQLQPIRSRRSLAASFAREASRQGSHHPGPRDLDADEPGPVRLAYALRWGELGPAGALARRARSDVDG